MTRLVSIYLETTGLDCDVHEPWEVGIVPFDTDANQHLYQLPVHALENAEPAALQVDNFYARYTWPGVGKNPWTGEEIWYVNDMTRPTIIEVPTEPPPDEDEWADEVEPPPAPKTENREFPFTAVPSFAAARNIAGALSGATLLGCNVQFDARFLGVWLRAQGVAPSWSHLFLDLGSFAAGAWGSKAPLSSTELVERIPNEAARTALGEAKWNMEVYRAVTNQDVF